MPYVPVAIPSARAARTASYRPSLQFVAEYRRGLEALSGHTLSFSRSSSATMVDSAGATITVAHSRPRREARSWLGTSEVGLRVSTDDLTYSWDVSPQTGTWLVEAIDLGTAGTSNAGLLYLGNDAQSGARLVVRGTGTTYAVDVYNASGATSTATLSVSVASGAAVQLLIQLEDNGTTHRVRIGGRVAGPEVAFSAWGTAQTRAAAWGSGTKLRLNRIGSAGTQGSGWLRKVAYGHGLLSLDDLSGVI